MFYFAITGTLYPASMTLFAAETAAVSINRGLPDDWASELNANRISCIRSQEFYIFKHLMTTFLLLQFKPSDYYSFS